MAKPREVRDAEQASSPVSDDTILRVITAFEVGVGKYTKLVRRLLPKYSGYECKEPESGKFTLSFRCDSSPLTSCVRDCQALCTARSVCLSVTSLCIPTLSCLQMHPVRVTTSMTM